MAKFEEEEVVQVYEIPNSKGKLNVGYSTTSKFLTITHNATILNIRKANFTKLVKLVKSVTSRANEPIGEDAGKVEVFFESSSHAEHIATLDSEETYLALRPTFVQMAKKSNMVVTENII